MNLAKTSLGIEFGSTRIKAVLLDENRLVAATGGFTWENKLIDGVWTYGEEDIFEGLKACFADLKKDFEDKFGEKLTTVGAIGISGMMHGILAFDENMKLLTPFRTWRNTDQEEASEKLSSLFDFNIPQRWSIAHLYTDILRDKEYLKDIKYFTTLSGYIHYLLTGEKVLGVGEASGMFPIDSSSLDYNQSFIEKFDNLIKDKNYPCTLREILPKVLPAGVKAGCLIERGAALLDASGDFGGSVPFSAPEGDAGTGMVATNSVRCKTGNVSAGTSIFAMVVTDQKLSRHEEIDMVTTPDGYPVAMVHCNNCSTDINGWVSLFKEFSDYIGADVDMEKLYTLLFNKALEGEKDCGGLLSYNYFSGEHITGLPSGIPMFLRKPDSRLTLGNFMRTHIYSAFASLRIGLEILKKENVEIETLLGHGGLFKTPCVAQRFLSAAAECEVSVSETAGEGGPYGMALLAAFLLDGDSMSLPDYLDEKIFKDAKIASLRAEEDEIAAFGRFMELYKAALPVEKSATEIL